MWTPSVFQSMVTSNLQNLQASTNSGVGYVLPEREYIGHCLQQFVDNTTAQQVASGQTRVNPLSPSQSILSIYV